MLYDPGVARMKELNFVMFCFGILVFFFLYLGYLYYTGILDFESHTKCNIECFKLGAYNGLCINTKEKIARDIIEGICKKGICYCMFNNTLFSHIKH